MRRRKKKGTKTRKEEENWRGKRCWNYENDLEENEMRENIVQRKTGKGERDAERGKREK